MTSVLAIDVGTSAVKAAIVAAGGSITAFSEISHPTSAPQRGWVEQHPEQWWEATVAAVRQVVDGQSSTGAVDVVAVTGQMQNLVTLDGDGIGAGVVRPAILYSDGRASAEHERLGAELGAAWATATGAIPDASNVVAKWRWLVDHEPQHAAATRRVLFGAHAFVTLRMTGIAASDPTTAATTGLYDLGAGDWWPPAVAGGGLAELLAPLHRSTEVLGALDGRAAAALGLVAGTPVVQAPGDAIATTAGIVGSGTTPYVYLGTSGWTAVTTQQPRPAAGAVVLPGRDDATWITVAPILSGGSAIDWARTELLGGCDFAELDRRVGGTCAAAEGVFVLPHLAGTRSPVPLSTATGTAIGIRPTTTAATLAAAVVEGLAHTVRQQLTVIGAPEGPLLVCGGAARLNAVQQVLADVTGRTVHRVTDLHAAVRGAASAALVAVGDDALEPATVEGATSPDPERARVHSHSVRFVDALLPTMTSLFDRLAEQQRQLAIDHGGHLHEVVAETPDQRNP